MSIRTDTRHRRPCVKPLLVVACGLGWVMSAAAQDALLGNLLEEPGSAGLGFMGRLESSPYRSAGDRRDLLPLYLYEGERFFLRANAAGVRASGDETQGLELFVERRLEGYPEDDIPDVMEGMAPRNSEADVGARYFWKHDRHLWDVSLRQDASGSSDGSELRASYGYAWRGQRWSLLPVVGVSWRSSKLNDYYFGVRDDEVTAERDAWSPGAGVDLNLGLYAKYRVLQNWSVIGGVQMTRYASEIRDSPLVDRSIKWSGMIGASYDFGNGQVRWDEPETPTYVKVFYGRDSADGCHLVRIMTLQCAQLNSDDPTDIWGVHVGRPFVSQLNGWPLDLVGYVGVLRHDEKGHQPDAWQLDAYMKGFYYGFPWSHRVKTRLGFGFGVSYAERVPYAEVQSQARRERNTSKVLNYLDPSIDVSVGDLFGSERWRETYFGFGVSHRSGIFGSARLLGTVDGGSNYIYTYLEAAL